MRSDDRESLNAVIAFSAVGLFLTLVALVGRMSESPGPDSREVSGPPGSSDEEATVVTISHVLEAAD